MWLLIVSITLLCQCVFSNPVSKPYSNSSKLLAPEEFFIPMVKCYGNLGCFSTAPPFFDLTARPINFLPQERDVINTGFKLFTRNNINEGQLVVTNNTALLAASYFNADKETKFIVHGFLEFGDVEWMNEMRKALLLAGDVNVFQVDWSGGARSLYTQATADTRLVGAEMEHFIQFLQRGYDGNHAQIEDMHIIGHSLGAHVAGYAGRRLHGALGRISGLDPAGPYFENTDPMVRLDHTDAKFVDAIHTDAHSIITLGLGIKQTVGHVDIYPNGGETQVDCSRNPITQIIINGVTEGVKWVAACDHLRVLPLYTESIIASRCPFRAYPCSSYEAFQRGDCIRCGFYGCASMGYFSNQWQPPVDVNGVKMYMDTKGTKNFCRFHNVIRIETSSEYGIRDERGLLFIILYGREGITNELKLTKDPIMIKGSTSYQYLLKLEEPVGEVYKVVFRWEHKWTITQPSTVPVMRTPKIYVAQVKVSVGVMDEEYLFCGDGRGLNDDTLKTMHASNSC